MFILDCNETVQMCYNMRKILVIVKTFISVIQWSVPLVLVFMGTIDMFKAVTKASDQKVVQDATKSFVRRLIAGVIVFLIPFLVRLVLGFVENNIISDGDVSSTSWVACWNNVDNKNSSYFSGCSNIYNRNTDGSTSKNDSSASSSSKKCTCVSRGVTFEDVPVSACTDPNIYDGTCKD